MNSSPSTRLRSLSSLISLVFAFICVCTIPFTSAAFISNTHTTANPTTTSTSSISSAYLHQQLSVSSSPSSSKQHRYHQISPIRRSSSSSSSSLSANRKKERLDGPAYTVPDPFAFLGNFRFLVPALFLAQILFSPRRNSPPATKI